MKFTNNPKVTNKEMKPAASLKILLSQHGYSENAVKEIWKWYDFSERKGVANF
jgi:hypothetical protein